MVPESSPRGAPSYEPERYGGAEGACHENNDVDSLLTMWFWLEQYKQFDDSGIPRADDLDTGLRVADSNDVRASRGCFTP
jgi:hypothetical protein